MAIGLFSSSLPSPMDALIETLVGPVIKPFVLMLALDPELYCMAEAVYFEARNQHPLGQAAVAAVVHNRAQRAGKSTCSVVRNCQFSYYCDGKPETINEPKAWETALAVSYATMTQGAPAYIGEVTHFHSGKKKPCWAKGRKPLFTIQEHKFYVVNRESPSVCHDRRRSRGS